MERMSGTDAVFLGMETANTPQHVAGLSVLDVKGGQVDIPRLKAQIRRALVKVPKFTRVVKHVPFGLDLPVWEDDRNFDLDRHIRHIAVPAPGGKHEVGSLVGDLMSMPLDRRFPLWEIWVIEGLDNGRRAATFLKYHHSLMDGKSGASLAEQLFNLGPDDDLLAEEEVAPQPRPRLHAPSSLELLARSPLKAITGTWHTTQYATAMLRRAAATMIHKQSGGRVQMLAPSTIFNGAVGRRRLIAFSSLPLDDVKRVAKNEGVKVNDVVMTLVAGAVRKYLLEVATLPEGPLTAMMAVSTAMADSAHSNQIASVPTQLPSHLADPVERLRAVFESTSQAKELLTAIKAHDIQSIGAVAPPLLINVASQALARAEVASRLPTPVSLLVSNIPGPPIPLYQAGSRVLGIFTGSLLMVNMALNITLMSYAGRIDLGFTVDPDVVPRADFLAEGVPAALEELMAALDLGEPSTIDDAWAS